MAVSGESGSLEGDDFGRWRKAYGFEGPRYELNRMNSGNREIEVDGIHIREGTGLYDTEYDRVLWITDIDDTSVTVKPVTDYEVDDPTGWPPGNQTKMIAEGTVFSIHDLKSLIGDDRFEISP